MRIIVTTYLSLDGVMQGPGDPQEDTAGDFTQGGWQAAYPTEELGEKVVEWITGSDGLLLGRKTYDIFAAYWPNITDDAVADPLNAMPKYVVSTTLDKAEWHDTTVLGSIDAVRELKARPGGDLLMFGSGDLIGSLLDERLVDELRLWTYPVVLGDGKRLFEPGRAPSALRLVESSTTGSGCVYSVYRPQGDPTYGTMKSQD